MLVNSANKLSPCIYVVEVVLFAKLITSYIGPFLLGIVRQYADRDEQKDMVHNYLSNRINLCTLLHVRHQWSLASAVTHSWPLKFSIARTRPHIQVVRSPIRIPLNEALFMTYGPGELISRQPSSNIVNRFLPTLWKSSPWNGCWTMMSIPQVLVVQRTTIVPFVGWVPTSSGKRPSGIFSKMLNASRTFRAFSFLTRMNSNYSGLNIPPQAAVHTSVVSANDGRTLLINTLTLAGMRMQHRTLSGTWYERDV